MPHRPCCGNVTGLSMTISREDGEIQGWIGGGGGGGGGISPPPSFTKIILRMWETNCHRKVMKTHLAAAVLAQHLRGSVRFLPLT